MKKLMFLTVAVAILAFIAPDAMASVSDAQSAGQGLVESLTGVIGGNIGLFAGVALALFGLWTWLVGQNSWGIIMIIGGVIVTAFPGIFSGMSAGAENILKAMGGNYTGRANTTNSASTATGTIDN